MLLGAYLINEGPTYELHQEAFCVSADIQLV